MKYTFHENLSERNGVISNLHGFLNRHLDTGFKSKWSGYWVPPYKFLDYFAFKVNGIWLDAETLEATEYGEKFVFHHETDSLLIREKISVPGDLPGFRVNLEIENKMDSRKAVHALLEAGVDIREKSEDISREDYKIERNQIRLMVSRHGKNLVLESGDISDFSGGNGWREHFPGEKQVCYVPPKPIFRTEIESNSKKGFSVDFKTSEGVFGEVESKDQTLEHDLGRSFSSSIESLENLTYSRNGTGIIAGHPWFQDYWARDAFWSLLGYIDAGYFETSRNILENFAEKNLSGKIGLDGDAGGEIRREDTEPLFIIASEKLGRHDSLSNEIETAMEKAMKELEMYENGVVKHSPDGTWTDTIERSKAVDIQSLWLEAARLMDDERKERLREGLELFEEGGRLVDCLENDCGTINTVVPVMFGQVEDEIAENQLEKINGEFSSRYGARTRGVADPGYNSSGYHTGSVWGLTTCWAAAANLRYGKYQEGLNMLGKLEQFLDRNQPGALPEVVDAESGELLGASEQAWSAGLMVHVIDSYLLGMRAEDGRMSVNPSGNISCVRRGKRVSGEKIDLRFEEGDVEVLDDTEINIREASD